jgi:hypothetical protein
MSVYGCGAVKCVVFTWQSEQRVRLRGQANGNAGSLGLFVDLGLPVVDLVLLGDWEVALHTAFGVEELDLGAALDKAVCNLELRLKFPCRDALFLNCEEL